MSESRVQKTILNAKVNTVFFILSIIITFFSRKIFLERLGTDFMGLTGTIGNLLALLNLAELGIGTAVGVLLYKPLYEKKYDELSNIISVFGYLYRQIGKFILLVAVLISLSLPLIFKDVSMSILVVFVLFYSYLFGTLLSYWVNFKQILLNADQKNYLVASYYQSMGIISQIIQMITAFYTGNVYLWILINLLSNIGYSVILNYKIKKIYPWLNIDLKRGRELLRTYKNITTKSKQVFFHKIASFILNQTDQFLIFKFTSLSMVAYYSNYLLLVDKVIGLINNVLGSSSAGVGNLIAEGNQSKIKSVFWELMGLRFYICGLVIISLMVCVEPFIIWWLGEEYILSPAVFNLLLLNTSITLIRPTVDMFLAGYGLFKDTWAPALEAILNLFISIVLGLKWGITGVLTGTLISTLLIVIIWKPFFLYNAGFKTSINEYIKGFLGFISCFVFSYGIVKLISHWLLLSENPDDIMNIIWNRIVVISLFTVVYSLILFVASAGVRRICIRFIPKLKSYGV